MSLASGVDHEVLIVLRRHPGHARPVVESFDPERARTIGPSEHRPSRRTEYDEARFLRVEMNLNFCNLSTGEFDIIEGQRLFDGMAFRIPSLGNAVAHVELHAEIVGKM